MSTFGDEVALISLPKVHVVYALAHAHAPRFRAFAGSRSLLKSNFFALENRVIFVVVLDPIWVDLGPQDGLRRTTKNVPEAPPGALLKTFFFDMSS